MCACTQMDTHIQRPLDVRGGVRAGKRLQWHTCTSATILPQSAAHTGAQARTHTHMRRCLRRCGAYGPVCVAFFHENALEICHKMNNNCIYMSCFTRKQNVSSYFTTKTNRKQPRSKCEQLTQLGGCRLNCMHRSIFAFLL